MNVWHQVDKHSKKPVVRGFLRPVVLAPLFTAVVALLVWWAVLHHPSQNSATDMNDLMYSVAMRELKPDNYPDEAIQSVMDNEMSYSIYNYFINRKEYSTVQEISSTAGDWEQISQSMAEQSM